MATLRKVAPGDQFDGISASTWNALVDSARAHINPNNTDDDAPAELNSQYLIQIRNETDEQVDRFQPLGLDGVIVEPTDDESDAVTAQFIADPVFEGVVPTFDHRSRFAILQDTLQPGAAEVTDPVTGDVITDAYDGQTGRALLYGITAAKVDVTSLSHRFAQPADGAPTLQTVDFGGARVIYPTAFTSLGEQWTILLLTGNGQATTGERVSGELVTAISGARKPDGGREPGTALLRVWTTDPDHRLEDQSHNRYAITGVTPTDPDDLGAGQSFVIGTDVRFRLIPNYPIQVVESTSRDGTYVVESMEWDSVAGETTIHTSNAIAEVLDEADEPVVDGTILIPGGDRRKASDRYVIVENYSNKAGDIHAWCSAVHDGAAYVITEIDH